MAGIVLQCPNCDGSVNIGYTTRFNLFECSHCRHRFRGIYARTSLIKHIARTTIDAVIGFGRGAGYETAGVTPCPYCHSQVTIDARVCAYCRCELPRSPAGEWRKIKCGCGRLIRTFDWANGSMPDPGTKWAIAPTCSCGRELGSMDIPPEIPCRSCGAMNCVDLSVDPGSRCNWCRKPL